MLAASFPGPGDADRIRKVFADDLGVNRLGLGATRRDGAIHFAFPIVILVGRRSPDHLRSETQACDHGPPRLESTL